jgi:hypothetical protein
MQFNHLISKAKRRLPHPKPLMTTGTASRIWAGANVASGGGVDLRDSFPIESIKIMNRWYQDVNDENRCMCHLSHTAISLLDDDGKWADAKLMGNTCQILEIDSVFFEASPDHCV